jgi:hypothetical protein
MPIQSTLNAMEVNPKWTLRTGLYIQLKVQLELKLFRNLFFSDKSFCFFIMSSFFLPFLSQTKNNACIF